MKMAVRLGSRPSAFGETNPGLKSRPTISVFQFAKEFPEECIYVAIKAEENAKDGLSGKYYFHSLHKNVGAYVREPKRVPGYTAKQFFLVYQNGVWYIQSDDSVNVCFLWGGAGGHLRLTSKGW